MFYILRSFPKGVSKSIPSAQSLTASAHHSMPPSVIFTYLPAVLTPLVSIHHYTLSKAMVSKRVVGRVHVFSHDLPWPKWDVGGGGWEICDSYLDKYTSLTQELFQFFNSLSRHTRLGSGFSYFLLITLPR